MKTIMNRKKKAINQIKKYLNWMILKVIKYKK